MKYFLKGIPQFGKYVYDLIKYFIVGFLTVMGALPRSIVLLFIYIFDKKQRKNIKKNKNPLASNAMLFISLSLYFMCVYIFFRWTVQTMKINNLNEDIIKMSTISEENDNKVQDNNSSNNKNNNSNSSNSNNSNNSNSNIDNNNNTGYNGYNSSNNSNFNITYVNNNSSQYQNLKYLNVNLNELLRTNADVVGWIKVEGTKVNYSIVQSDDNDYYLKHDINKKKNSAGWIFADFRSDLNNLRRNTIIYGHNMNNKTMFGSIPSTLLSSAWQNNPNNHYIRISTPKSNSIWKVFSVYTTAPNVDYLRTIFTDDEYKKFINSIQSKSFHNFNSDVSINDYILTLSTCDDTGKKRMVTHAKLIKYQYR